MRDRDRERALCEHPERRNPAYRPVVSGDDLPCVEVRAEPDLVDVCDTSTRGSESRRSLRPASPPYILVTNRRLQSILRYEPALKGGMSAFRSRLKRAYEPIRTDAGGTSYLRRALANRQRKPESVHAQS